MASIVLCVFVVFFRESPEFEILYLESKPLCELEGQTAELIGTNINGNPYGKEILLMLHPNGFNLFHS